MIANFMHTLPIISMCNSKEKKPQPKKVAPILSPTNPNSTRTTVTLGHALTEGDRQQRRSLHQFLRTLTDEADEDPPQEDSDNLKRKKSEDEQATTTTSTSSSTPACDPPPEISPTDQPSSSGPGTASRTKRRRSRPTNTERTTPDPQTRQLLRYYHQVVTTPRKLAPAPPSAPKPPAASTSGSHPSFSPLEPLVDSRTAVQFQHNLYPPSLVTPRSQTYHLQRGPQEEYLRYYRIQPNEPEQHYPPSILTHSLSSTTTHFQPPTYSLPSTTTTPRTEQEEVTPIFPSTTTPVESHIGQERNVARRRTQKKTLKKSS
jgi:hypothetical protein